MSKKKKIAFVNQPWNSVVPPVQSGSIALEIYEVARRLADFYDVTVYAKRDKAQSKVQWYEGVQYRRVYVGFDLRLLRGLQKLPGLFTTRKPLFARNLYHLGYIIQIADALRRGHYDVVHLYNFSQFAPIIRFFNPKIKIILDMRCEWLTQLEHSMIESRLKQTDLVFGCSEYITNTIRESFAMLNGCCKTVYGGVDITRFVSKNVIEEYKSDNAKRLLFVGRISPEKGLHVLLEAFKNVAEQCPQAQLEIVGGEGSAPQEYIVGLSNDEKVAKLVSFYNDDGEDGYFDYLQDQLRTLDIEDRVTFYGSVPYGQLVSYYQNADILVNPSLSESFGRSLIEAMSCCIPVVATRVGGMTDIVEDGETGFLVEADDPDGLANAMLKVLWDENLSRSMGQAGRKRILELFSWERTVEDLLYHYEAVCENL